MRESWLKRRAYRHLDVPWPSDSVRRYVYDPKNVERHAFLPLLHRVLEVRRFREGEISFKARDVYYAGHVDSAIYGKYAETLSRLYETLLATTAFGGSITAYRKLDGRCNIHFAKDVFDHIRSSPGCAVLCFDISKFFDSLDHRLLKDELCGLLDVSELPLDYYQVIKSVMRFAYVDLADLLRVLGLSQRSARMGAESAYCTPLEFRTKVRGADVIRRHKAPSGVPQGTPISAVLSNIYMLTFDKKIAAWTSGIGGTYRRYSDDIIIIVPEEYADAAELVVRDAIVERKLSMNEDKFERVVFEAHGSYQRPKAGSPSFVQYLGFTFDGRSVRVRSGTLARHHQRMRRAARRAVFAAKCARNGSEPYCRSLFRKFTHIGPNRTAIRYILRASSVMGEIAIRRQVRNSVEQVKQAVAFYQTPRKQRKR